MMKRKIPPLTAVVAFECAARHQSFKNAGDELCVSPSAISHQVRALENWMGVKMFERSTRKLALTDAGRRYLMDVRPLLDGLAQCSSRETLAPRKINVNVQTTDSIASRWLAPNLHDFQARHPDVAVKIITHDYRDGLRESEADVGILFVRDGQLPPDALSTVTQLSAEEIFPVCSPELVRRKKLSKVAHLESFPLIHDDNVGVSWREWILAAGASRNNIMVAKAERGCRYNHAHLALQCAELGGGVTLASNALTADALKTRRLVAPFDTTIRTGHGYYLARSSGGAGKRECEVFVDWIISKFQSV